MKLELLPRNKWKCPRCVVEESDFTNMKSDVNFSLFTIPRRKSRQKIDICFSLSKPLSMAFEECCLKGIMIVPRLLTFGTINLMTHGNFEEIMNSGRITESWNGAVNEITKRLNATTTHNLINRGGRYDMRIPDFVIEQLHLVEKLTPLLDIREKETTKKNSQYCNCSRWIRKSNMAF